MMQKLIFSLITDENNRASGVVRTPSAGDSNAEEGTTLNGMMTLNRHPKPLMVSSTLKCDHSNEGY